MTEVDERPEPVGPTTRGPGLAAAARALTARRTAPARRTAALAGWPGRRWPVPGERRLRVEADPAPAWDEPEPFAGLAAAPLPPTVRERLTPVVGPGLERVVVRAGDADPAADALARRHDAAAVTVGEAVHLRQGRFAPGTSDGVRLLAHEAWHAVSSARPAAAWRRSTPMGRAEEEAAADAVAAAVDTPPSGLGHAAVAPAGAAGRLPPSSLPIVGARRVSAAPGRHGSPRRTTPSADPLAPLPLGAPGAASGTGPALPRRGAARSAAPASLAAPLAGPAATPAATPMAFPADTPLPTSPPPAAAPTLAPDAVMRDLLRQLRTEQERGA